MLKEFFRNPLIILHALFITMAYSFWTVLQLSFKKVPHKTLDERLRQWSKKLLDFIHVDFKVHNPHGTTLTADKPHIVMCNHSSYYDIPLSVLAVPGSIRMIAKKELLDIPVWGKAMQLSNFVSIDRFNPRQALKDMKYAKKIMEKGIVLWIAPEGTRSRNGELLPFKPGGFRLAIECGATIIPLGIRGSGDIMAARSWIIHKNRTVHIHLGKPIETAHLTKKDRQKLMEMVDEQIRSLIQ